MTETQEPPDRLVFDMPDDDYRSARGVSQSAAKAILDCAARYEWQRNTPQEPRDAFDFGHVVHAMTLGAGANYVRLNYSDRRTNAYKEEAKAAREEGFVPLVSATFDAARAAADSVLAHPLAGPLLTRPGWSEVSGFWSDEATGRRCKMRVDRLTILPDGTHLLMDVKTISGKAAPDSFARHAADFGYHVQQAAYEAGYRKVTGVEQVEFLFVAVEVKPPHFVGVYCLSREDVEDGWSAWRRAIDEDAACTAAGSWPGYTDAEPATLRLPTWHVR